MINMSECGRGDADPYITTPRAPRPGHAPAPEWTHIALYDIAICVLVITLVFLSSRQAWMAGWMAIDARESALIYAVYLREVEARSRRVGSGSGCGRVVSTGSPPFCRDLH